MSRVGILYHPMVEATKKEAEGLKSFLAAKGVSVWLGSAWETAQAKARLGGTDLLLTVGGDGTILRAAQIVIPGRTPITGINLGKLGFMTELEAGEAREKLPALLKGKGWLDERVMLSVTVAAPGRRARRYHALNDVVAARGEIARAVQIEALVDGQHLASYKTDGVIAATATGSTGYSLAAGGPVLPPPSRDFLLVPIAPHLNPGYPIVLPGTSELTLRVGAVHPATLSIDGHINLSLAADEVVTIRRSPHKIRFLRCLPETSFYGALEEKLKGKR